jgi:hypothetical protein
LILLDKIVLRDTKLKGLNLEFSNLWAEEHAIAIHWFSAHDLVGLLCLGPFGDFKSKIK